MVIIENKQVYSTEGKHIHRVGSDAYFKRGTVLASDTAADYEEVDEIPAYTEAEYRDKVAELIRQRYSADEETSLINNVLDAEPTAQHRAEYAEYQAYRAQCKARAKDPSLYRVEEPID